MDRKYELHDEELTQVLGGAVAGGRFECDECHEVFNSREELDNHMVLHIEMTQQIV